MSNNRYTLELRLDTDQVTKALAYQVTGESGTPMPKYGPCAGTFHFEKGDTLFVSVIVSAKISDEVDIQLTDFTIASVPLLAPGKYPLSMFDQNRACVQVNDWNTQERHEDLVTGEEFITINAKTPLNIVAEDGQWEFSGYLSTLINKTGLAGSQPTARLFYFDPEGTTGGGGTIG